MLIPRFPNLCAILFPRNGILHQPDCHCCVQIVMNNILRHYGAESVYGSDIPIACAGIISKVNQVFMAICIGISQGSQPSGALITEPKNTAVYVRLTAVP